MKILIQLSNMLNLMKSYKIVLFILKYATIKMLLKELIPFNLQIKMLIKIRILTSREKMILLKKNFKNLIKNAILINKMT